NVADDVLEKLEQDSIKSYVIGGHSLGGMVASRYAIHHPDGLKGVFFVASYPDKKGSLKQSELSVLSLFGSEDGLIDTSSYEEAKIFLPNTTQYVAIDGGNHAQFGSLGQQLMD